MSAISDRDGRADPAEGRVCPCRGGGGRTGWLIRAGVGTIGGVARYDYRCRTCDERFEVERPMSAVVTSTPCPAGHLDTVRVLTPFMTAGVGSSSRAGRARRRAAVAAAAAPAAAPTDDAA